MQSVQVSLLPILVGLALAAATWSDVWRRVIPNRYCMASLIFGAVWIAFAPSQHFNIWSIVAGGAALVVGTWGHARGLLGGGDVKLLSALLFWLPIEMLSSFFMFCAISSMGISGLIRILAWRDPLVDRSVPMAVPIFVGYVALLPRLMGG